jgi:predicted nucleic acid-binding protein
LILIDTNVLMYVAGREHPHRADSVALLQRVASGELDAAIDAEVLREILHRYRNLGRWEDGRRVYDLVRALVPDVVDIDATTMDRAAWLMGRYATLTARDAVHAAATLEVGAEALCTWDTDFDAIGEIRAIRPTALLAG